MNTPSRRLPVARNWFSKRTIDSKLVCITEPYVDPLLRSNTWWLRGHDRDLIVDSGVGICSLKATFPEMFERDPLLIVTHAHLDHVGGAHEFTDIAAHRLEVGAIAHPSPGSLHASTLLRELNLDPDLFAVPPTPILVDAVPTSDYEINSYQVQPAAVTRILNDADSISVGEHTFLVLHLPGHSPGSIGLLEQEYGQLFSGDALYDGVLLDGLHGSDRAAYCETARLLLELDFKTVHAGHGMSFDHERAKVILFSYLNKVKSFETKRES
jgi:glyoxylase-like metal-dependent hydrolase (beta-lactamase superfamily II)